MREKEQGRPIAASADEKPSCFVANMSHEIRTPLTAILGFVDLLCAADTTEELPENWREMLGTIQRNGSYLMQLINDTLDLTKIENGSVEVELLPCALSDLLVDVMLLLRRQADAKELFYDIIYRTPLPQTIQTDPTKLKQVLLNLVSNAIKFTPEGSVRLELELLPDDQLLVEVCDTGLGLSPAQQRKLFQPFVQADISTHRQFGGSGLGLSISKQLVEMLGGTIEVESELGIGSVFAVKIPIGDVTNTPRENQMAEFDEAAPITPPTSTPNRAVGMVGNSSVNSVNKDAAKVAPKPRLPYRILLAEDGIDNQRLIQLILKKAGAKVDIAVNGKEAFEMALAFRNDANVAPYDIILMDMLMPVLDGRQATASLRAEGYGGPILALSANTLPADRQIAIESGCNDFAAKPIDRADLFKKIQQLASSLENVTL